MTGLEEWECCCCCCCCCCSLVPRERLPRALLREPSTPAASTPPLPLLPLPAALPGL